MKGRINALVCVLALVGCVEEHPDFGRFDTMATSSSSGGGSSSTGAETVVAEASVADCIREGQFDPDQCKLDSGEGEFEIDLEDGAANETLRAYLRFDFGPEVASRSIVEGRLELTVSQESEGGNGELWRVVPFERTDLFDDPPPARAGPEPVAGATTQLVLGEPTHWDFSGGLVEPDGSMYFELYPVSTESTKYYGVDGPIAIVPMLTLTVQ